MSYEWVEDWPAFPAGPLADGWAHTGVALTAGGEIAVGAPAETTLLFFDGDGTLCRRTRLEGPAETHAFQFVEENGAERFWLADSGSKDRVGGGEPDWTPRPEGGGVAQFDLDGQPTRTLARPGLEAYARGLYQPTAVAVDDTGAVWVADGYGASLVHRFDAEGRHVATLTGEEGAGRFECPHALMIDHRRDEPELYVADRANARLQVFDLAGRFKRAVGEHVLAGPSGLACAGDVLVVADLFAGRLSLFDADDRPLGHLFPSTSAPGRGPWPDAWPNARAADGSIVRPPLRPGQLNSPHAVAADAQGNLFVTEWVLGGRYVKLARRP